MKIPNINARHLLTVTDLTGPEIISLFRFTDHLKKTLREGKEHAYLKGKILAMIFEKRSTRTRVSFEAGIIQLGGHGIFLSSDDIQIGRGETIADTARVLSRYVNGIMIRTYSHDIIEELAANSAISVINGLTDTYHPCQALTDFFTIYERKRDLKGIKLTYVGDGNNMANSLLLGGSLLGVDVSVAAPKGYQPEKEIVRRSEELGAISGARIDVTDDIDRAVAEANYLYTDVWVSMGQEREAAAKKKALKKYKITARMLAKCAPGCLVMHCLPAHRGEEIDDDVIDSDRSIVFDEAENRLHMQKALMSALLSR